MINDEFLSISPTWDHTYQFNPNYNFNTIRRLLMNQSEQINELATALAKCQGEITPALKDSNNPFFKSKYADLNAVWSVCREPLSRHGLCVIQTIDKAKDGEPILITTLAHSSGQWIKSVSPIPVKEEIGGKIDPNKKAYKNDPQALGSSITYMRRYNLSSIVGISTDEDDDGEKAMNPNGKESKESKERPKAVALPCITTKESKERPKAVALPCITTEECTKITELADSCDPEYIKKIRTYLDSQGIKTFAEIKLDMYNKILNGMIKNTEVFSRS
jgi:hypothetical protein